MTDSRVVCFTVCAVCALHEYALKIPTTDSFARRVHLGCVKQALKIR